MKQFLAALAIALPAAVVLAVPMSPRRPAPSSAVVTPRQENQFATVDEFIKARRASRTAVSIEGYAVTGRRAADGGVRLALTDSVDHVLTAADADAAARAGASCAIPRSALKQHPAWAWTARGLQRFAMYAASGAGRAQRGLHDTVARIRVTGLAAGRGVSPVARIEYTDDNGDWKRL